MLYTYTTEDLYSKEFPIPYKGKKAIRDKKGNVWGFISGTDKGCMINISKGYAWNGCSPKFSFMDLFIIGTPDGINDYRTGKPKTYYASLVHDFLYQFKKQHGLSRKQCDMIFIGMLKDTKFFLRHIYYIAVRLVGWMFWHFGLEY